MLKRIRTEDVDLGMFLERLEGPWLSHPFWKRRFLLQDPRQLANLKSSAVEWVQIDVTRGRDIDSETFRVAGMRRVHVLDRAHEPAATAPRASAPFSPAGPLPPVATETATASGIAKRSLRLLRAVFDQARLGKTVDVTSLEPVVNDIMGSIRRHPHAFGGVMRLMKTSDYLHAHALSVCALMINLATEMGLGPTKSREAGLAGLLMDIGMGHVPAEIYEKDSALSPAELDIVQSHTRLAHDFMEIDGGMPPSVLDVCLHHHERLDGSGYPDRLSGAQISMFARMAAVCDSYDAMTSWRPHKLGIDPAVALAHISDAPALFDQDIVEAFIRAVGIYPVGSLVRLQSGRLAIVMDQNPRSPTMPWVRTFYDVTERRRVKTEDIDLAYRVGRDGIVGREVPADWDLGDWEKLSAKLLTRGGGVGSR